MSQLPSLTTPAEAENSAPPQPPEPTNCSASDEGRGGEGKPIGVQIAVTAVAYPFMTEDSRILPPGTVDFNEYGPFGEITDAYTIYGKKNGQKGQPLGVATSWKKYGTLYSRTLKKNIDIIIPTIIAYYFDAMVLGAKQDGVQIVLNSGYRTPAYQKELRDKLGEDVAAPPGQSNHQLGIAVDVGTKGRGQYAWLCKNAWKYGFVRTVMHERWHWEYRGTYPGMTPPEWAVPPGTGMFQFVPEQHITGVNSRSLVPKGSVFKLPGRSHPDQQGQEVTIITNNDGTTTTEYGKSKTNTWIGLDGDHLPTTFDAEDPGWLNPDRIPDTVIVPVDYTKSTEYQIGSEGFDVDNYVYINEEDDDPNVAFE